MRFDQATGLTARGSALGSPAARWGSGLLIIAALGLGLFRPSVASAVTMRDSSLHPKVLQLGDKAQFQSVGRVTMQRGGRRASGSGVYLGNRWVLTAGHITDGSDQVRYSIGGETYRAAAWAEHAGWREEDLLGGDDLSMMRLERRVRGVNPVKIYTGSDEIGSIGWNVGYGLTGNGEIGVFPTSSTLHKRAGSNVIDEVSGERNNVLLADFDSGRAADNDTGSAKPTAWESAVAPGDSGGAMFIFKNHRLQLAGINSFGYARKDRFLDFDFGDLSGYTRVSSYASWINNLLNGGELNPPQLPGPPPRYKAYPVQNELGSVPPVPEPGSLTALAAGGLLLLPRRRARR